ncbi:MAG: GDP-4-dehydro-6-deoxy-D-mannose reductase [Variibacter sp.]|jgi:GDP-4-dehydro-6-deoxy-D-mannose reductase|nr:GDP-4-dehydro-6-deoxy-D-mannose reductase [Variibacter sp.]
MNEQMPADANPILITGASGFVGRWVVKELRRRLPGGRIVAAGHGEPAGIDVVSIDLDVTAERDVDQAVRRFAPACVIHLAAISGVPEARSAPRRAWDVNVNGTMALAEAVLRHVPDARFVYVGSADAYGGSFRQSTGPLDESALLDPLNAYGASKAAADLLVGQMAHEGLNAIRLRSFNHTGPGQGEQFAVSAFASQIARIEQGSQEPSIKVGNLEARRDFLDVRDVVRGYADIACAEQSFPPGLILNIASGVSRRMRDVLEELVAQSRVRVTIEQDESRMRPTDTPVAIGDARRAESLIGWRPQMPFKQTLRDVLDHWRQTVTGRHRERSH